MAVDKKKTLAYLASGGAVLGFASSANADLVFNSGNASAGMTVSDTTFSLDLDGDGTLDLDMNHDGTGGFYGTEYAVASASGLGSNLLGGSGIYLAAGASGGSVSAGGSFTAAGYLWDGYGFAGSQFSAGTTNFMGVQFDIGGATHFGFVEVAISDDPNSNVGGLATSNVISIVNYAYNDTAGEAATFTQPVPEPGSLGLLALGAAGIGLVRRKKNVA